MLEKPAGGSLGRNDDALRNLCNGDAPTLSWAFTSAPRSSRSLAI